MSVRIVVDSTADLRAEVAEQVTVVPLTIRFGEEEYIDGVTIDSKGFYEKLIESNVLPTTSQATPCNFEEVFRPMVEAGDTVVALTVSAKLSGTYQSACIAAEEFPGKVFVVDSQSVAVGSAILAEYALELTKQGLSAEEVAGTGAGYAGYPGVSDEGWSDFQDRSHCRQPAFHQAGGDPQRRRD